VRIAVAADCRTGGLPHRRIAAPADCRTGEQSRWRI